MSAPKSTETLVGSATQHSAAQEEQTACNGGRTGAGAALGKGSSSGDNALQWGVDDITGHCATHGLYGLSGAERRPQSVEGSK